MKNEMKIFIALLIAAMSTFNFNVKAQPPCPGLFVTGNCTDGNCFITFTSANATHHVHVCTGTELFFDIQNTSTCPDWWVTTNVTGGFPPCASSFPGTSSPVLMSSISQWSCIFSVPGTYQYIFCIQPVTPSPSCPTSCAGCVTLIIDVADEIPFTITGPNNNCLDADGITQYTLVPPTGYTGTLSISNWIINGMSGYSISQSGNDAAVDYNGATFDNNGAAAELCADIITCCGPQEVCIPIYQCCTSLHAASRALINNTSVSQLPNEPTVSPYLTYPNGVTTLATSADIYINGTFTIDQSFTFEDCPNIKMGPEAKILIKPLYTLTFSSPQIYHAAYNPPYLFPTSGTGLATVVEAGCDFMWDGIYFDQNNLGTLIVNPPPITGTDNYTTFMDARNVIVSDYGAPFTIRWGQFQNNNKDIIVNTFTGQGPHPGTIERSILTTDILSFPMRPYYTPNTIFVNPALQRTNIGIEINKVEQIQIGSTNPPDLNQFSDMDVGIWSKQSLLLAYNNSFDNIHRINPCPPSFPGGPVCPPEGICIFAQAPYKIASAAGIGIGLGPGYSNTFTNSDFGISVQGKHNVNVAYNTFNNVLVGTDVFGSAAALMTIHHNTLDKCQRGVRMLNNASSTISITDNDFNPANTIITQGATAITVQEALLNPSICPATTVSANTIKYTPTGIQATNLYQANIVGINDIYYPQNHPDTWPSYGIRVQNNNKSHVLDNWVYRCSNLVSMNQFNNGCFPGTAPNSTYINSTSTFSYLSGISVESSNFTNVINNYLGYLGSGIRGFNIPGNNTFQCNVLGYNRVGFWFDNSDPGVQGTSSLPQDNRWNIGPTSGYSPFQDVYGFGPNLVTGNIWYEQAPPGPPSYPWNPPLISPGGFILLTSTFPNTNTSCTYTIPQSMSNIAFQKALADIIRATEDPACTLSPERIFESQLDVYKELMYNSNLMNLSTPDDAYLQDFYDDATGTAIGQLANVRFLIGEEDYQGAENENSNVTPENQSAANERIANEIYLATWAKDIYTFTQAQYDALLSIAEQNPVSGGSAVYTARVMLGLDFNDIGPSGNRIASAENTVDHYLHVYPNPAASEVTVYYSLGSDEKGLLVITDITGRELLTQELAGGTDIISISTTGIANGIYYLRLSADDALIGQEKLVIIK